MEINHVLIVEDDKEIREGVQIYLQSQGYKVFQAADGIEGLEVLEKEEIHLAIIDIMMPRMDGIRMTMKLREKYDFPVIMLSAKSEEVDKITGLNIGADDYVTKPFTPMELMARVNSQLRRYRRFLEKLVPQENVHVIGGLEINEDTVEVTMDGNPVKLTPIEYKILLLLAKNPGRVFSSEEIYERVWQEKAINTDTIMVHVRNIREKIEIDPIQFYFSSKVIYECSCFPFFCFCSSFSCGCFLRCSLCYCCFSCCGLLLGSRTRATSYCDHCAC